VRTGPGPVARSTAARPVVPAQFRASAPGPTNACQWEAEGVSMFSIVLLAQQQGLTLRRIITDIPHDGPAFFVYGLLAISIYVIWRGSRVRPQ
jgi:hypothetical protein